MGVAGHCRGRGWPCGRTAGVVLVRPARGGAATLALVALALVVARMPSSMDGEGTSLIEVNRSAALAQTCLRLAQPRRPQAMAVDTGISTGSLASLSRALASTAPAWRSFILGAFGVQGVAVDSTSWTNSRQERMEAQPQQARARFINTVVPAARGEGRRLTRLLGEQRDQHDRAGLDGSNPRPSSSAPTIPRSGGRRRAYLLGQRRFRLDRARPRLAAVPISSSSSPAPSRVAVDSSHIWWTNGRPFYAMGVTSTVRSQSALHQHALHRG